MGFTVVLDIPMAAISSGPRLLIMQIYCFKMPDLPFYFFLFWNRNLPFQNALSCSLLTLRLIYTPFVIYAGCSVYLIWCMIAA
jgi:hypothetical protein